MNETTGKTSETLQHVKPSSVAMKFQLLHDVSFPFVAGLRAVVIRTKKIKRT